MKPFDAAERGGNDGYAASTAPTAEELANRPALIERARREFDARHAARIRASQAFDLDRMKQTYADAWVSGFHVAEIDRDTERRNQAYWARIERVMTERNLTREEAIEAERAEYLTGAR